MMLFNVDDEDEDDFDWGDEEEDDDNDDDGWGDEEEDDDDDDYSFLPDDDESGKDFLTGLLTGQTTANYLPIVEDNKKARVDITKNSSEDHRTVARYTKKELEEQLVKDYKYFKDRCKSKIVVKPFLIMGEYPFKKKKSDSDIIDESGKNVEEDYVLVIGRLPKLKGTEEFKGKPYIRGLIAYIPQGNYDIGFLKRHFGIVVKKKYKIITKRKIRPLFDPVKGVMRNGWPFSVYKEFPRKITSIV